MPIFRNKIEQQLLRNGIPQRAWIDGTKVLEGKKQLLFDSSQGLRLAQSMNQIMSVANINELPLLVPYSVGGALRIARLKNKYIIVVSETQMYSFNLDGTELTQITFPNMQVTGIVTNMQNDTLYVFNGQSSTSCCVYKTQDLFTFTKVLEEGQGIPCSSVTFMIFPPLNCAYSYAFSVGNTRDNYFFSFETESFSQRFINTYRQPIQVGKRDCIYSVNTVLEYPYTNFRTIPTIASTNTTIIGECLYQGELCLLGGSYAHSSLYFYSVYDNYAVRHQIDMGRGWDGPKATGSSKMISPEGCMQCQGNVYLHIPYNDPENYIIKTISGQQGRYIFYL